MRARRNVVYGRCLKILIIFLSAFLLYNALKRRSTRLIINGTDVVKYGNSTSAPRRIPRIIHQTYNTHEVPVKWNATVQSVMTINSDFEYQLWTFDEMAAFVKEKEPEFYENTYKNYPYEAQRIDSFRYVMLFYIGGIYIDMDNGAKRPFHELVATLEALYPNATHIAAFPPDDAVGLQSDFQIATPGHPFYRQLISRLPLFNRNYLLHYITILLSAGPLYVTVQEHFFTVTPQHVIGMFEREMYMNSYHWKVNGATWHGRDTAFILYLFYNRTRIFWYVKMFLLITFAIVLITILYIYRQKYYKKLKKLLKS